MATENGITEEASVRYGSERIKFTITRRERKTLAITVHPDLRVTTVAPLDAELDRVLEKVQQKAKWITKQQRRFLSWMPKPTPRNWKNGETHRYLGRQYRLRLSKGKDDSTKLRAGFLEVTCSNIKDSSKIRSLVTGWYRERAAAQFQARIESARQHLKAYDLPEPTLRIRRMEKRWGSCTIQGEILLNPDLVKAPGPCIDYVIFHELCHLRHPNHNREFFRMLDAVLPDWRKRKNRLEKVEI